MRKWELSIRMTVDSKINRRAQRLLEVTKATALSFAKRLPQCHLKTGGERIARDHVAEFDFEGLEVVSFVH
jgi:hypothetical protein